MNKKLQVFVSSTYTDLIEERQAAVEAILDAGHIPAGMELFKAGNRSQLETIYKWIDESDIYMLILGGRYGSIEEKSGKSYTQLEYEYALSKNIPVFSVVLTNRFLHYKASLQDEDKIFEKDNIQKYQAFKSFVMSKIIRQVDNLDKISITIHTTLLEFLNDTSLNLVGWIKDSGQQNTSILNDQYAQILLENHNLLKEKIDNLNTINYLNLQKTNLENELNILKHTIEHAKTNILNNQLNEQVRKILLSRLISTIKNRIYFLNNFQ